MQNYIYKLVRERDLAEWNEIAPTTEYALALFNKKLAMQLECCENPSNYWLEKRIGGSFYEAPEIISVSQHN